MKTIDLNTLVGVLSTVTTIIAVIITFDQTNPNAIPPKVMLGLVLLNNIATALVAKYSKSSERGSDRPQEVVDAKLDNLPPRG